MAVRQGSLVRLHTPDNHHLDRALARVTSITDWGAHVLTAAAASGTYRALFSEMEPVDGEGTYAPIAHALHMPHHHTPAPFLPGSGVGTAPASTPFSVYTGDACDTCGSFRMRRAGSCLICEDCGANSGCG